MEPLMFTMAVTTLWTLLGLHKGSQIPIAAFGLTGYSTVLLWRNMPAIAESAVKMNIPLMHHRNVRIMDLFISRLLLQAGGATLSFIILGIFFTWIGWIKPPEDPLKVIMGWIMMTLFGMSLAIYIGALATQYHVVEKIWHPLSYIMMPMSGAVFLLESFPQTKRVLIMWIPMVNGCEWIRDGYFGSQFRAYYSPLYLVFVTIVLFLLGMLEVRKLAKKTIR